MAKAQLTLIGCLQGDLLGKERLHEVLCRIKPDIVSVEYDVHSLAAVNHRKHQDRERAEQLLRAAVHQSQWQYCLERAIASDCYDYDVAQDYARQNGITLQFLRACSNKYAANFTNPHIAYMVQALSKDPRAVPDMAAMADETDRVYKKVAGLNQEHAAMNTDSVFESRLEQEARATIRPGKRAAHICDASRLVDDAGHNTLYSLLKDLKPKRILISDGFVLSMSRARAAVTAEA